MCALRCFWAELSSGNFFSEVYGGWIQAACFKSSNRRFFHAYPVASHT
jgi:hypothetical protein